MEKASKELLKEFVNNQHFTSTTEIMNSMKELFSDVQHPFARMSEGVTYIYESISKSDIIYLPLCSSTV